MQPALVATTPSPPVSLLPQLKYVLFSAALKFWACGSPLYIHMTMKAYKYTSFANFKEWGLFNLASKIK